MSELIYAIVLVFLGLYNWRITNKLVEAEEQIDGYNHLILQMAEELEALGSPHVKVIRDETVQ